jgi:hypothetical protein
MNPLWDRFREYYLRSDESLGFSLDISRMKFDAHFFEKMQPWALHALHETLNSGPGEDTFLLS